MVAMVAGAGMEARGAMAVGLSATLGITIRRVTEAAEGTGEMAAMAATVAMAEVGGARTAAVSTMHRGQSSRRPPRFPETRPRRVPAVRVRMVGRVVLEARVARRALAAPVAVVS